MAANFPEADGSVPTITPDALYDAVERGDDVFVLDARSRSDFEEWHVTGDGVEIVNRPYFDLLEGVPDDLAERLPADRTITVLCAKGGASELVTEHLREAGFDAVHLADGMQGWARIYRSETIDADADATIRQYRRPSSGCLSYLVVSDGAAAVVDPLRAFTDRYVADAREQGAEIEFALDTHVHADHLSGVRDLADEAGATPVLPAPATDRGVTYDDAVTTVADGDAITLGDATVEALHTPGHTTGMTTYRVGDVLFTGDGLFVDSVARPDLEDPEAAREAARTLHESLTERVLAHPDDAVVAPAHYGDEATPAPDGTYTARLGDLTDAMDALRMEADRFVEFVASDMPPRPANYETIIATNLGRESPGEERAFELELGPNNCAASDGALTD